MILLDNVIKVNYYTYVCRYATEWYNFSPRLKSLLIIMLCKTSIPCGLKAGNMIPLSIATYATVSTKDTNLFTCLYNSVMYIHIYYSISYSIEGITNGHVLLYHISITSSLITEWFINISPIHMHSILLINYSTETYVTWWNYSFIQSVAFCISLMQFSLDIHTFRFKNTLFHSNTKSIQEQLKKARKLKEGIISF